MGPVGCGGPGNAFIPVEELLELEQQPLSAHILGDAKGIVMGNAGLTKDRHPEWEPIMIASEHHAIECKKEVLRGRAKLKMLPRPTSLVAHIRPSCASTMIFETYRPSPDPAVFGIPGSSIR